MPVVLASVTFAKNVDICTPYNDIILYVSIRHVYHDSRRTCQHFLTYRHSHMTSVIIESVGCFTHECYMITRTLAGYSESFFCSRMYIHVVSCVSVLSVIFSMFSVLSS